MRAVIEESTLISSGKFVHGPMGRKIRETETEREREKERERYTDRERKEKIKKEDARMIA